MRFPKQTIDVDAYLKLLASILVDEKCHIFIDTNIISQLYRLNEDARKDFYTWIKSCQDRFHVPVWCIHEYSKRVYSDKTTEYLCELNRMKSISDEFQKTNKFLKGYMGSSMLVGTQYNADKQLLFDDLDTAQVLLTKISGVIKNQIAEHQNTVHEEVSRHLSPYSLKSDVYSYLPKAEAIFHSRCSGIIPPGFKDENKNFNPNGDLVVWMEILDFCSKQGKEVKAVLLTRDRKSDWVYEPKTQKKGNRKVSTTERIRLAHESLVYEFMIKTGSNDFYIIDFEMLVKLLAPYNFRDLAKSFQISEANDLISHNNSKEEIEEATDQNRNNEELKTEKVDTFSNPSREEDTIEDQEEPMLYSGIALMDEQYNVDNNNAFFDDYISKLLSYDWYVQNPALAKLMTIKNIPAEINSTNRDSAFVLGRNILQSAEGSSGNAITYMERFSSFIRTWPVEFQKALIDGMLFEIFFNSKGELRNPPFKATYLEELLNNVNKLKIESPFDFINRNLDKKSKGQWVPRVGISKTYTFTFAFDSYNNVNRLDCNGMDITYTFPIRNYQSVFSHKDSLKIALSAYYAIPTKDIMITELPPTIATIFTRVERFDPEDLPF